MFSCLGDIPRSKRESAHISMSMLFPSSGPRLSMFVQWQEAGPPESLEDFSKASAGRAGFIADEDIFQQLCRSDLKAEMMAEARWANQFWKDNVSCRKPCSFVGRRLCHVCPSSVALEWVLSYCTIFS